MKKISYQEIVDMNPCYDPIKHIPSNWTGTILDLLLIEFIPVYDVLWVASKGDFLDQGILRRFAAWCAAESLFLSKQSDSRSWRAVEIAIKYSLGDATPEELESAQPVWWSAAESARSAAELAARSVAGWSTEALAAQSAAWWSAQSAQRTKLLSMLKQESDFTLSDLLNNYPIKRTNHE